MQWETSFLEGYAGELLSPKTVHATACVRDYACGFFESLLIQVAAAELT
jgi:hypothetical protein